PVVDYSAGAGNIDDAGIGEERCKRQLEIHLRGTAALPLTPGGPINSAFFHLLLIVSAGISYSLTVYNQGDRRYEKAWSD
uniref:hypothetical protein n=1 Tax=Serratia liquefaciens TaxID=614 RepID=UPI00301C1A83